MLAGGSGLADGFFAIARSFIDSYSFISFNYPIEFEDNNSTADAIYELIKDLKATNVPSDDKTFTDDIKESLINIMTEPVVVNNIEGGHLAMMFNTDNYIKIIDEFLDSQNLN